jgi:hypothetical protein
VHQWKYGEGEGEEEVEKRRKWRETGKRRDQPPFNHVLHPPLFRHLNLFAGLIALVLTFEII